MREYVGWNHVREYLDVGGIMLSLLVVGIYNVISEKREIYTPGEEVDCAGELGAGLYMPNIKYCQISGRDNFL